MRPHRFVPLFAAAVNRDGQLTAATYPDAGINRSMWGIIVTGPQVRADVQVVARSANGDNYSQPEQIVTGPECAPLPSTAPDSPAGLERYLAALTVAAAAGEVAYVDLYSPRGKPQAIPYGATLDFYSGAKIFLYVR